jgi:glycine cleavage system H protein
MTAIDQFEFPDDLSYDEEHIWAKAEGDIVTIGMSQFGQDLAGEIVYVEVPRVGRAVSKGEAFMSMESGKWVGRVKSPISGEIVEANEEVEWESTLVNEDPYGEGWLAKIKASDLGELDSMMKADSPQFAEFIAAERKKYEK